MSLKRVVKQDEQANREGVNKLEQGQWQLVNGSEQLVSSERKWRWKNRKWTREGETVDKSQKEKGDANEVEK